MAATADRADAPAPDDWGALMACAQAGNREAYRRLLLAIAPRIRAVAARVFRERADEEDVVQDVLITLHRIGDGYDPARPFLSWLFGITRHRVLDRLRPPLRRPATWLAAAVAAIALLVAWHGFRPDLAARLAQPVFLGGLLAAGLTGVLAAVAAVLLGLPDRSRAWGWLPVPAALAWLASVSTDCLTDWVRLAPEGMQWGNTAACFCLRVLVSVPLSGLAFWMLRHAARLRPAPAIKASALILLWNFGTVVLVMAACAAVGRRLLR